VKTMDTKKNRSAASKEAEPLMKQTLSDQIYERLKEDIITHRISFGEKLVNRELQQKFGVSSTPVRDAINHLYLDGLLDNITNGGARVISFDLSFALEVNEVVMILTQGAIQAAAREERLGELAAILARVVEKQKNVRTIEDYILLDRQFHQAFFTCGGNRHLDHTYHQYTVLFEMLVRLSQTGGAQRSESMAEHQKIYECCRNGDQKGLEQEMRLHYQSAADWFTQHGSAFGA